MMIKGMKWPKVNPLMGAICEVGGWVGELNPLARCLCQKQVQINEYLNS